MPWRPEKLVYAGDTPLRHSVFPLFAGSEMKKCMLQSSHTDGIKATNSLSLG